MFNNSKIKHMFGLQVGKRSKTTRKQQQENI